MRRGNAGSYCFEDARRYIGAFCAAMPDMALHYNEVFGAGEQIVARGRATGTNEGTLFGMPDTKEAVEFQVLYIAHVENGKIVERWLLPDLFLTMMRRVGLTPTL